jgi:molybdate transport system regulatory protein
VGVVALKTKVWLEIEGSFVIGDGGLLLLQGIHRHGSLLAAAREMRWSYRHAWGYLKRAEEALGVALTVTRAGKGTSRGMTLTDTGHRVAQRLVDARRRIDKAVGPSGPTAEEIAARGAGSSIRPPTARVASRFRDGNWRNR